LAGFRQTREGIIHGNEARIPGADLLVTAIRASARDTLAGDWLVVFAVIVLYQREIARRAIGSRDTLLHFQGWSTFTPQEVAGEEWEGT
jgi:hypothetical protein